MIAKSKKAAAIQPKRLVLDLIGPFVVHYYRRHGENPCPALPRSPRKHPD